MMPPAITYRSSAMTTAAKFGDQRAIYPISRIADIYEAFEQDYSILRESFATTPFNTASPDNPAAYLQSENGVQDISGGIRKWTRTYYPIPPDWSTAGTFAPTFPGYPGYVIPPTSTATRGRNPFSPPGGVDCKIYYEYFMVGTGQTYATEMDIPLYPVQQFPFDADATIQNNSVVPAAGLNFGTQYWGPTTPTQETYKTWITNAAALGWASGKVWLGETNPGQFVVQSTREQLAGNIWARVTRAVLAQ